MSQPLRIVFAGTPEFAAEHLKAVLHSRHEVIAVYTQPDRAAGRGQKTASSAVKQLGIQHGLPVLQPHSLKDRSTQQQLAALAPDLLLVVAYGLLLPQAVLDIPRLGCINSHASLLPRWRGAAPIQRAIEAGDSSSGISLMQMQAGLDTGPVLLKASTPIFPHDNAESLYQRLAQIGPAAVLQALDALSQGSLQGEIQDESLACYAHKLRKEEGELDWSRPAGELSRRIRAFYPWPGSYSRIAGKVLKILEASASSAQGEAGRVLAADKGGLLVACGEGALRLTRLQLPGGKPLAFADLLNSRHALFAVGSRLGA